MVSVLLSCQAGLTSSLLGCVETASDCLSEAGHYDCHCSGSTSEISSSAMEVLPNPLDSKTYNRLLVCRHCCGDWCCCGFLAVSYSPVSGPNLSVHVFLLPTLPMFSSLQHPVQQCLQTLLSSILSTCRKSWGPVAASTAVSWAVFQKLVVRAPSYCLRLNEA